MHGELSAVDALLKYPSAGGAHNIRKRARLLRNKAADFEAQAAAETAAEARRKTYLEAARQTSSGEGREAASAPPSGTKRKAAEVALDAINAHKMCLEDMSVTVTEAEMRVTIKTRPCS
jgi:hypothetical protein